MFEYKTVVEKAAEWCVPAAQIQALCREQKIEGAHKHGGVWFIPAEAENPFKENSDDVFPFQGTKQQIFTKAVELFAKSSFELVTIKDIAKAVGVAPSAVYNHFQSKQEILNAIYSFFREYNTENRVPVEELLPVLETEPMFDILHCMDYGFKSSYEDIMVLCIKILIQRVFFDETAQKLFREVMIDNNFSYVKEVYDKALETGRFSPFSTTAVSEYHLMCRIYVLFNFLIGVSPERMELLNKNIYDMDQHIANAIEQTDTLKKGSSNE